MKGTIFLEIESEDIENKDHLRRINMFGRLGDGARYDIQNMNHLSLSSKVAKNKTNYGPMQFLYVYTYCIFSALQSVEKAGRLGWSNVLTLN